MDTKFYNLVTDSDTGCLYIDIFDQIGGFGGFDDYAMREALANAKGETVTVRINSGGGDVFTGQAIYNLLKQSGKHIKVIINGLCASIASVIAMAGDEIEMPSNTLMMIHNPSSWNSGTAEDMRKNADVLDKVKLTIQNVYANRTGLDIDTISAMMDDETWMSADEAKEKGFCDAVLDAIEADDVTDDSMKMLNSYKHTPKQFQTSNDSTDVRDSICQIMSEIGYLRKEIAQLKDEIQDNEHQSANNKLSPKPKPRNGWTSFGK